MGRRYSRRRGDGIVEYSESLEDLANSAVREREEGLRATFGLVGFLLGAILTYGLLKEYTSAWPKAVRFIALLVGASSSAFVFARLAVALRMMLSIAITASILGGLGYLLWRLL